MLALDSKIKILEANLAAQAKTMANTLEVTGPSSTFPSSIKPI